MRWRPSRWGVSDRYLMYAGGLMSPMRRCFSDLVWQPLVTSYVIDAYLCLAMSHAWTIEYQHMMLCVWRWIYLRKQKGNGQLEKTTGSPSRRVTREGSDANALRCGDLRSPGVMELRNGSLGLRDYDHDDKGWLMSKMEGKTNFSRHLQAVRNRNCWMSENH